MTLLKLSEGLSGNMWRIFRIFAGSGVVLISLLGFIYCIRLTHAQKLYYDVEYGSLSKAAPYLIAEACKTAHNLYHHNYNLCNRAAATYWGQVSTTDCKKHSAVIDKTEHWCERGLSENRYKMSLRYRKAELLSLISANDAADYWEGFVDWQFWSSQNLSILVKYYARAGRLVEATEVLSLLKGHPDYQKASSYLRKAWAKEMSFENSSS